MPATFVLLSPNQNKAEINNIPISKCVFNLRTNLAEDNGRYSVFPNGELHIRNVSSRDATKPFRCMARHELTGAKTVSSISGR